MSLAKNRETSETASQNELLPFKLILEYPVTNKEIWLTWSYKGWLQLNSVIHPLILANVGILQTYINLHNYRQLSSVHRACGLQMSSRKQNSNSNIFHLPDLLPFHIFILFFLPNQMQKPIQHFSLWAGNLLLFGHRWWCAEMDVMGSDLFHFAN